MIEYNKREMKIGKYHDKKLTKEAFDEIYRQVPRLCVEAIIIIPQGIILTKRLIPPCVGMWHIPGGTVYLGEKLEDAVKRVADDELGIDINIKNRIGIIQYLKLCEDNSRHAIGIAFLCEPKSKEQKFRGSYQGEEINAFKIIPDNTVPEQKIFLDNFLERPMEK
jgi:colanic acid biosynthesis protein WcaH